MSSVRNRILQFQQNSNGSNGTAATTGPPVHFASGPLPNTNHLNGNGLSTSLKSSYARNGSHGSIPPDIVATTVSHNQGRSTTSSSANKSPFGNGSVLSNNNNNINSSSVSSQPNSLFSSSAARNGSSGSNFCVGTVVTTTNNTSCTTRGGSGGVSGSFPYASSQKSHPNNSSGNTNAYFGNSYGSSKTSSVTPSSSSSSKSGLSSSVSTSTLSSASSQSHVNIRKFSGNFSSTDTLSSLSSSVSPPWSRASSEKKSPAPEPSHATIVRTVEIPLKSCKSEENFGLTPPAVNRANKPSLAMKKASMTINLSSLSTTSASTSANSSPSPPGSNHNLNGSSNSSNGSPASANGNGYSSMNLNGSHHHHQNNKTLPSPTRPKARTPTRASPASSMSSSIPKLNSPSNGNDHNNHGPNGFGYSRSGSGLNSTHTTVRYRDPSPGGIGRRSGASSNRTTPATTPTGSNGSSVAFGSTFNGGGGGTGRFYQSIGWKEKFEESEKKKNHLVTLAQRATRDYEELRRRYQELYTDHEKVTKRFESATSQLESLRKASEATYQEYHKLKRRYEAENVEKSEALTRVDEYNKENRRLKRQSALMMQQIDPSTLLAHATLFDSVPEGDSPESDKEVQYLRRKVKEMEAKIIDLETELERIRLSEFESQESVLLMNDSIQSSKNENLQLKEQLRKLDEENRKLARSLEDLSLAHDSLKQAQSVDEEKLQVAETELKKLLTEKNILQRQSLVFMNNEETDNRLLDALAQIDELQRAVEDQKNSFESQIIELKNRLSEKELEEETLEIQHNAKIKALEEEIMSLRERADEAERKLEDSSSDVGAPTSAAPAPPPPPPPPPMSNNCGPAPPPPPPPPAFNNLPGVNGGGLGSSLQAAMGSLKKGPGPKSNLDSTPNGSCDGQGKSLVSASPQIDDIVSQLKQGIKLRHIDRTTPRKQLSTEKSKDENPVENLRSVLDNMRRTRTVDRRF